MKKYLPLLQLLCVLLVFSGCATTQTAKPKARVPADHPVAQRETLFEMLRYIYLWQFDESYFIDNPAGDTIELWVRDVSVDLDAGDKSQFAEVWLPQIKMLVTMKKSDYRIPELNLDVRDDTFKIQTINRLDQPDPAGTVFQVVSFTEKEVTDHLFRTRNMKRFPNDVLRKNLRAAMIEKEFDNLEDIDGAQIIYVSPISPVSNDLWVYHENRKRLIQFSADMDLNNPEYWNSTPFHVEVYDLETSVIVSPDEMPGSDAYLTKDFTGRALFNCLILGMRIEISADDVKKALSEAAAARKPETQ